MLFGLGPLKTKSPSLTPGMAAPGVIQHLGHSSVGRAPNLLANLRVSPVGRISHKPVSVTCVRSVILAIKNIIIIIITSCTTRLLDLINGLINYKLHYGTYNCPVFLVYYMVRV